MIVYLALSAFILSLLLSLVLLVTGKSRSTLLSKYAIGVHACFILCALASKLSETATTISILKYSFLLYVCSGVVTAGIVVRSYLPVVMKVYFMLFFAATIYLVYSPADFGYFLLTARTDARPRTAIHLKDNYYLEKQQASTLADTSHLYYKLTQEYGLFHKTIQRNIKLPTQPDSVKVLQWVAPDSALLHLFYTTPTTDGVKNMDEKMWVVLSKPI